MALAVPILSPLKSSTPAVDTTPNRRRSIRAQSNKENSPPITYSPSPRKAILNNPSAVNFKSSELPHAPRAWERRPATPYVPRNESQKIWKRVPLAELGVEVNQVVSKREEKQKEDYVRVVKKLKVEHDGRQSVRVMSMMEDQSEPRRRQSVGKTVKQVAWPSKGFFFGMREESVGSPRKRRLAVLQDPRAGQAHDKGNDEVIADDSGDETFSEDEHEANEGTGVDAVEVSALKAEEVIAGIASTVDVDIPEDDVSIEAQATEEGEETTEVTVDGNDEFSMIDTSGFGVLRDDTLDDTIVSQSDHEAFTPIRPTYMVEEEITAATAGTQEAVAVEETADEVTDVEEETQVAEKPAEVDVPEEMAIVSKNTIEQTDAEQISPAKEGAAKSDRGQTEEDNIAAPTKVDEMQVRQSLELDDTAFLHAFISRNKAQRAAKDLEPQDPEETAAVVQNSSDDQVVPSEDTTMPSTIIDDQPVTQDHDQVDEPEAPVSPVRRSKRATTVQSTTSIPAIPRIQLKRPTGNEFIFTANKSATPANTALVTRTNTRRNRGTAVHVPTRLEQLKASSSTDASTEHTDESALPLPKKRKRDNKTEQSGRSKKVLRWNDDQIASYREPEANAWEDAVEQSAPEPATGTDISSTLELSAVPATEDEEEISALAKKISSPSKVRRVRRTGTNTNTIATPSFTPTSSIVVATPATAPAPISASAGPKTRSSRRTATTPAPNESAAVKTSVATAGANAIAAAPAPAEKEKEKLATQEKTAAPAKKSRMPVRVARSAAPATPAAAPSSATSGTGKRSLRARN